MRLYRGEREREKVGVLRPVNRCGYIRAREREKVGVLRPVNRCGYIREREEEEERERGKKKMKKEDENITSVCLCVGGQLSVHSAVSRLSSNSNNVHLSCAHQRPEGSHHEY